MSEKASEESWTTFCLVKQEMEKEIKANNKGIKNNKTKQKQKHNSAFCLSV